MLQPVGQARVSLYSLLRKAVTSCDLGPGYMFGEVAAIVGAPFCQGGRQDQLLDILV